MMKMIARKIYKLYKMTMTMIIDFYQNFIISGVLCPIKLRPFLYRMRGHKIGYKCYLSPQIFLGPGGTGKLIVGNNVFINYRCFFDLLADIVIEDNCNLAMNVHCITGTHEIGGGVRVEQEHQLPNLLL